MFFAYQVMGKISCTADGSRWVTRKTLLKCYRFEFKTKELHDKLALGLSQLCMTGKDPDNKFCKPAAEAMVWRDATPEECDPDAFAML